MESISRMNNAITQGARAAARRLTTPACPELADDVEVALHDHGSTRRPGRYADPTALGSLIVSIATLAWTIYNDIRSRAGSTPTSDVLARRVRGELDQSDTSRSPLGPAERDQVIDITVEETLNAAQQSDPDESDA